MENNNETGHAVNAKNFVSRVLIADKRKAEYQPSNPEIALEALIPMKDLVSKAISGVTTNYNLMSKSLADRKLLYEKMDGYASRSINMLNSSGAAPSEIEQAKALFKKYKSERASNDPGDDAINAKAEKAGVQSGTPKKISRSEQGHVKKLDHFRGLVDYLKIVPAYKPKETELTLQALETFADTVQAKNQECDEKVQDWKTAINNRDNLMYGKPVGAHALSNKLQSYVLASFGKDSQFYKELMEYPVRNG